jgi:hypothetical protein
MVCRQIQLPWSSIVLTKLPEACVFLFLAIFCMAFHKASTGRPVAATECNMWYTTDGAGVITDHGCPQGQAADCDTGKVCCLDSFGSMHDDVTWYEARCVCCSTCGQVPGQGNTGCSYSHNNNGCNGTINWSPSTGAYALCSQLQGCTSPQACPIGYPTLPANLLTTSVCYCK